MAMFRLFVGDSAMSGCPHFTSDESQWCRRPAILSELLMSGRVFSAFYLPRAYLKISLPTARLFSIEG